MKIKVALILIVLAFVTTTAAFPQRASLVLLPSSCALSYLEATHESVGIGAISPSEKYTIQENIPYHAPLKAWQKLIRPGYLFTEHLQKKVLRKIGRSVIRVTGLPYSNLSIKQ